MTKPNAQMPPPCSLESERCLLGTLLHSHLDGDSGADALDGAVAMLRPDDFYHDAHQKTFRAIRMLWEEHEPVSHVSVFQKLMQLGLTKDVQPQLLPDLLGQATVPAGLGHYAKIIKDTATRRKILRYTQELAYECCSGMPADELLGKAERDIYHISENGTEIQTHDLSSVAVDLARRLDARFSGEEQPGLMTGLADLDSKLNGFEDGELILVGARTSVGKTSMASLFALNAVKASNPVLVFSLEQSRLELAERLLCMEARVDSRRLKAATLAPCDKDRLPEILDGLGRLPLIIDDTSGQTVTQIAATARRVKRRRGISMVVVDYVQLIESEDRRVNRQEQVSIISHRLQHLARELEIPVVALVQLNRECEAADRAPRLTDIRESDALAHDASKVLLLWKPNGESTAPVDLIDIVVAKNRNGWVGTVPIAFRKASMLFENAAPDMSRPYEEAA